MPDTLNLFQVDAFSDRLFSGNPAAVVPLARWLDDALMQSIAAENNLSETAYFVPATGAADADFDLRWFTPTAEVRLCGHATLASAHVLYTHLDWQADRIRFATRHAGLLQVTRRADGRLELDFPARHLTPTDPPATLSAALGVPVVAFLTGDENDEDAMAVLADAAGVADLTPDLAAIARLPYRGLIVTAAGGAGDCASRFFAPQVGIPEDPVTGSAHCAITPYWAARLGKTDLVAHQVGPRGGTLLARLDGGRVRLAGHAVDYLSGTITLPGARAR